MVRLWDTGGDDVPLVRNKVEKMSNITTYLALR
jgi:hypothetical protein